ncbi:MAG: S8 family serine peptidase [Lachnospiraceae bacterium]|nr:S8 family serine peptidase [Lachnospiraceae bacterium]
MNRNSIAVLIAVSLIISPVGIRGEEPEREELSPVSACLLSEAEKLDSMEAGLDYVDHEAVYIAGDLREAEKTAESCGGKLVSFDHSVARVRFKKNTAAALREAAYYGAPDRVIEPNYLFSLCDMELASSVQDPFLSPGSASYQYFHEKIRDKKVIDSVSGEGIRVAVIDSGVNPYHEELIGRVSVNYLEDAHEGTYGIDTLGHGTHVTGIIAAAYNNGLGGYGVAPSVSVESIQVTVSGKDFSLSSVAEAIGIAVEKDVHVINMSLGGVSGSFLLQEMLDRAYEKGIVCVGAAGNGEKINGVNIGQDSKHYPAAADHCISVASTTMDDKLSRFSNYGDWVDTAAPGSDIYSTYKSNEGLSTNAYKKMGGTSQAAPVVSAVAALLYSASPELLKMKNAASAGLITELICTTGDGKAYSSPESEGSIDTGIVQADRAVEAAAAFKRASEYSIMDKAGHYGTVLSGSVCEKKSIKLSVGDSSGKAIDKSLLKSVVWTSSDPGRFKVSKGKVRLTKAAHFGDTGLITASIGGETLYFVLSVDHRTKKMGTVNKDDNRVKSSMTREIKSGDVIDISSPDAAVSGDRVYAFSSTKRSDVSNITSPDVARIADRKYSYALTISPKDLKRVTVMETDPSGAPVVIKAGTPGKIRIKYKLLNGSDKTFKLILDVK